jgi:hypothetical protein
MHNIKDVDLLIKLIKETRETTSEDFAKKEKILGLDIIKYNPSDYIEARNKE